MIHINLLPVRAAKKKETQRFQMTVAGLVVVMVFILAIGLYVFVRSDANALSEQVVADQQELAQLALKIGVLSKIEDEKAVVKGKLDAIKKLENNKTGSIRLFKTIVYSMPEKVWLSAIKDVKTTITISGFAADEKNVADFARKLSEQGRELGKVELVQANRVVEAETKAEVMSFDITITRPESEEDIAKKAKKKPAAAPPPEPAPHH